MIKIKKLQYRSSWYKKNFYYLKSGQSLSSSTKISATCQETMQIHQDVNDGLKLSEVLSDGLLNMYFSKAEISLIKVAENTGNMEKVFLSLSQLLKYQHEQNQKLINAFIYPILILFMTFSLLLMILLFIIPKISPLFEDLKQLPLMTKIVIGLSNHLINYWHFDLFFVFAVSVCIILFKDKIGFINFIESSKNIFLSKVLYIRDIYLYWHIEKWLQIIHMSLSSNVTINDSLKYSYESINDKYLKDQFEKIYLNINKGDTVSNSLRLLDKRVYSKLKDWESIIDSGERTGKFSEVFDICHMNIKEDLNNFFERFQKAIEPMLIIFVGIIVLIICISIMLPMYQLTQSLQ